MMHAWRRATVASFLVMLVSFVASNGEITVSKNGSSEMSVHRRVEDAAYPFDLSQFSIRFGKCQYVKTFDDEIAADEQSKSPFAVKHFVVYRLCPSDSCESCDTVYGDYVAEVEEYLAYTTERQKQQFERMCQNCNDECDGGDYCSGCGKTCYQYDNLEENGLVDASDYIECQRLDQNGGDDGDGDLELYIGPRCSKDGSRIVISLFSDENCWEPYSDLKPQDVLGLKLSYHILSDTYSSGGLCLSCMEDRDNENANDQADADEVNEMCENIYDVSAKCESRGGIENGFIQMMEEEDNYENQVENEFMVCTFIDSLVFNSYTEKGEINIYDEQDEVIREATKVQIGVLALLAFSTMCLFGCIAHLNRKISTSVPKVDLSTQATEGEFA